MPRGGAHFSSEELVRVLSHYDVGIIHQTRSLVGGIFVGGPLLVSVGMAAMFAFALAFALYNNLEISCGCFGASNTENISFATLIRACVILLLSILAYCGLVFLQPRAGHTID